MSASGRLGLEVVLWWGGAFGGMECSPSASSRPDPQALPHQRTRTFGEVGCGLGASGRLDPEALLRRRGVFGGVGCGLSASSRVGLNVRRGWAFGGMGCGLNVSGRLDLGVLLCGLSALSRPDPEALPHQ
ncbi:hypothetical protein ACWEIJ_10890 [Lentzea sp. NPDC004789]